MLDIKTKTGQTIVIRRYTEADIPQMLDTVEAFLKQDRFIGYENHYKGIDFDRQKVYNILKSKLDDHSFFTNVVIDEDGKILGGLTGQITSYIFSRETVAQDWLFYFDPNFTNLTVLFALIKTYVDWAERFGVREVQLASSTGFKEQHFERLMKYIGFKPFSCGYSRRFR